MKIIFKSLSNNTLLLLLLWLVLLGGVNHSWLLGQTNPNLSQQATTKTLAAKTTTPNKIISPRDVIKTMVEAYKSYQLYTAKFVEINRNEYRQGKLYIKKPHHLYIRYFNSNNQNIMEVVANESMLYVYIKSLNVVCQQKLNINKDKDDDKEENSFQLRWKNLDRLIKRYHFNFIDSRTPVLVVKKSELKKFRLSVNNAIVHQSGYHFRLTPKKISDNINKMEIWVLENGLIARSKSTSISGSVNDILFLQTIINPNIPENYFEFEAPANAQILENILMDIN